VIDPINDGGQAFPCASNNFDSPGMSLRDWFAGQALQGLLASGHFTKPCDEKGNRCFFAGDFDTLCSTGAGDDRPSATYLRESKKCRAEYIDPAESAVAVTEFDCVNVAITIADYMIIAMQPKEESP